MLAAFYGYGLLLAFTGCVYPTIPILSAIIVGQGRKVTTLRAFVLSLAYVLGMALTYTSAGTAFAALGGRAPAAAFERPWIVASFAALFAAMALSMLGLFTVQMPAASQTRIASLSTRQSAGTLGGRGNHGRLSALLVTTCVGPALVAALALISQTGQVARGAAALFAMSIGTGTPLLVIGTSAGRLLPKAGPWMETIKRFFGAVMLGVAVWMLGRVLPARLSLALWAIPVATAAAVLFVGARDVRTSRWPPRVGGLIAGFMDSRSWRGLRSAGPIPCPPFRPGPARGPPCPSTRSAASPTSTVRWRRLRTRVARSMIDFYADWCTSCKEMEDTTFLDPRFAKPSPVWCCCGRT